jgi:calcium-dependent protein kinase
MAEQAKAELPVLDAKAKKFLDQASKKRTLMIGGLTPPFEEDFELGRQLGDAGQYGTTYQCTRVKDGESFAVKVLPKNRFYRIPEKLRVRYYRTMQTEIEVLQMLGKHPNIIKLVNVYEDKPYVRLVMEECTGGELFGRIVKRERYTEADAAPIIKQLFGALHYMHNKHDVVHCDLKPDNILFASDAEDAQVKIIDFGMSKMLPRLQYLTHLCGTPYYTAPEIVQERKEDRRYNHMVDMWAMGVIMYVMIFGYPPFYVDPERYTGKRERQAIYRKILRGFRAEVIDTARYGYGPWFPSHIEVAPLCRDLLSHLLKSEPAERFTAHEALTHPWVTSLGSPKSEEDGKESSDKADDGASAAAEELTDKRHMITSIAKFTKGCEFKKVVTKLFAGQYEAMRPHHFATLEKLFQSLDKDGDGVISYDEFMAAMASPELDLPLTEKQISAMFGELDMREMDGLRFDDLLTAAVHDYLIACDERMYKAFTDLDEDGDGFITTDQLKESLKKMDPLGEWDKAMEVIEAQSLDDSGRICYEEFLLALHPNFEETPDWVPTLYDMKSVATDRMRREKARGDKKKKSKLKKAESKKSAAE